MDDDLSMLSSEGITTILLFVLTFAAFVLWFRGSRKLPPGPYGLPIVGYLPFLTRKPYVKLQELAKTYGPIYSIKIGSRYVVVLCDYKSIKEAFAQDAFIGRPPDSPFELNKETIETDAFNGIKWKEQRRFALHTFRDLGFGKTRLEGHIVEEIKELLDIMEKKAGEPIVPTTYLAPSMSNNISSLVFGKRRAYDDPKRIMLTRTINRVGRLAGQVAWRSFFPWLNALGKFLNLKTNKDLKEAFDEFRNYVQEEIKEHKTTLDPNVGARDYIDAYLLEIEKKKNDKASTFLVPVLEDTVGGFFGAGSETVKVTVDWLMLLSAAYPDVQRKVQAEIDEVIGRERFPTRADHVKMPYTEAVITELMRWRTIIPINLLRYTIADTTLQSFFIPKHTHVLACLWAVAHDRENWGPDADEFRPERFLTNDGKTCQKPECFIPFSVGKRACPGESLATVEVFLYFTAILQRFNLRLPEGDEPDFEGTLGISLQAKEHKLCVDVRK